jgi:hypothetical protein
MNSSGVATTVWIQPDNTLTHTYANRTTLAPAGALCSHGPQCRASEHKPGDDRCH